MEAGGNVEAKKPGAGDQDLSMEEILQSIRRIIAEDDKDAPAAPAADNKSEEVPGSDILELTEMLKDDGSVVNVKDEPKEVAPAPAAPAAPAAKTESAGDVLAKINEALGTQAPVAEPVTMEVPATEAPKPVEPAPVAAPAPAAAAPMEPAASLDSLLSSEVAAATAAQFKRLGNNLPPEVHVASPPFRSGTTVEDLVTEMLRPMMKSWLDDNLPQIVERIVEREVRKLTQ